MARILSDIVDIPTATTRVQLSTVEEEVLTITFKAPSGNTGDVYIGDISVAAAVGFSLSPGDALTLDPSQGYQETGIPHSLKLSEIYIDAATSGNDVEYVALVV